MLGITKNLNIFKRNVFWFAKFSSMIVWEKFHTLVTQSHALATLWCKLLFRSVTAHDPLDGHASRFRFRRASN